MHVSKPYHFIFGGLTLFVGIIFGLLYYNQGVRTLNEAIDLSYNDLGVMARTSYVWLAVLGSIRLYEGMRARPIPVNNLLFGLLYLLTGLTLTFLPLRWSGEPFMWTAVVLMAVNGFFTCMESLQVPQCNSDGA